MFSGPKSSGEPTLFPQLIYKFQHPITSLLRKNKYNLFKEWHHLASTEEATCCCHWNGLAPAELSGHCVTSAVLSEAA